ncbi:MAG: BrnA antitoxin family protein [Acidobacteriia bacterium]|nr:BrnA antitoxin family protein [Terriglobia bacterium]
MSKNKPIEPIPEEFATCDHAAEFWDTHDTTHYPGAFRTVKVVSELRHRHYEIPIAPDLAEALRARARRRGVSVSHLTDQLLRRNLHTTR